MQVDASLLIAFMSVVFSVSFAFSNYKRNNKHDDTQAEREKTEVVVKLDQINETVSKTDMKLEDISKDVIADRERLIKVENTAKYASKRADEAHKRIGNLKNGKEEE